VQKVIVRHAGVIQQADGHTSLEMKNGRMEHKNLWDSFVPRFRILLSNYQVILKLRPEGELQDNHQVHGHL
jgi:hypothetical protein